MTNAARHAGPPGTDWVAGTGLRSMAERARRLGGDVSARPTTAGGRVDLRLPVVIAPVRD